MCLARHSRSAGRAHAPRTPCATAQQRPTSTFLGNGLFDLRSYNVNTARLDSGTVHGNGTLRLQESYQYDTLGNVTQRAQYWGSGSFNEGFSYDSLNRLSTSQVGGQALQTTTYDPAGNLKSKTGIGSYTYPSQGNAAIRPHAVQSTSSQGNFTYDDNGNLTTGAGRSITWTSYDMPVQLQRGTITENFVHGPEHQRLRQDRNDGSSLIYAGAQEVDTKGGTTIKTYWPGGLGVEIDKPGASTSDLYWHHKDRLGSPIALSSSDGSLTEKLAYDAWGRRRMIDGSAPLDNSTVHLDNKGYTGHEMLDQIELVHMNGRIYDPITARFLSGDPLIQDPINGQNYNRYSYVLNNPTNLTDPTGFATESVTIVGQRPICGFTCIAASAALALERMKSSALQSVMNSRSLTNRVASTGVTRAGLTRVAGVLNPVVAVAGAGYLGWQIGSEINDRWGDKIQGWLPDPMPIQNSDAVSNDAAGEKKSEDKPNLLDPKGDKHVLDGDGPNAGGGHRAGTGKPGKSEFPSSWSDDKIRGEISDVATDPSSTRKPGQGGRTIVQGTRDGIDITVVVEGSGRIVTGFPTNVPRNPP